MATDLGSPARHWEDVTPSNSVDFPNGESAFLYVGGTGNITAICDGAVHLFSNLAVGYHPIRCTRINSTGTTATLIKAAY